jgi:hypothetical protein
MEMEWKSEVGEGRGREGGREGEEARRSVLKQ